MKKQTNSNVQKELDKVKNSLANSSTLTREQYLELYSVQQTLSWVLNPELSAAPFDVVINGKVQSLTYPISMDTPAN